jgi:NAD(P)-dependent dehydrogenase (short-subunit alcohol dehydrogenase family)
MEKQLKGKIAIVTGAGNVAGPEDRESVGNGRAAAITYAREGASVMAVDINGAYAEETKMMIEKERGRCSIFVGDVSNPDDCHAFAQQCLKDYGRIDILHNNVGVVPKNSGGILDVGEEDWDRVMNTNLKSIFNTCRAVVPQMIKQKSGCIVNISSVGALKYGARFFSYTISKAAVNSFTKCLAIELAEKGIRVNCIMPGMMDTPTIYQELTKLYGGDIEKMREKRNKSIPMKKMGESWDTANAALFLVSDQAKYITGQVLAVDGGVMAAFFLAS